MERQHQISDKMEMVQLRQEESLQRREELVRQLETVQQMTRREQEEQEEDKTTRKHELAAQVTETGVRVRDLDVRFTRLIYMCK